MIATPLYAHTPPVNTDIPNVSTRTSLVTTSTITRPLSPHYHGGRAPPPHPSHPPHTAAVYTLGLLPHPVIVINTHQNSTPPRRPIANPHPSARWRGHGSGWSWTGCVGCVGCGDEETALKVVSIPVRGKYGSDPK